MLQRSDQRGGAVIGVLGLWLVLGFGVCPWWTGAAYAAESAGAEGAATVRGSVVVPDGAPLAGACVTVLRLGGSDVTGDDGSFTIDVHVPGDEGEITAAATAIVGESQLLGTATAPTDWGDGVVDLGAITARSACEQGWVEGLFCAPGLQGGSVWAATAWDDGTGEALYIGGHFSRIGCLTDSRGIVRWDGASWSALGTGVDLKVISMAVFDDGSGPALYVAGRFYHAGGVTARHIARWDGSEWSAVGTGMSGQHTTDVWVWALKVFDDGSGPALYAGGRFSSAGGVAVNNIARWDGEQWSDVGGGVEAGGVISLEVFDDGTGPALYAGGWFTEVGVVAANNIAKWDGEQWSDLGGGTNGTVWSLAVFDDGDGAALYAGGSFTSAGDVAANHVARWNGEQWDALGDGTNLGVESLAVIDAGDGAALYAGGGFTSAGGTQANRVAKWDGSRWSALGEGVDDSVRTLAAFDDGGGPVLYAGGRFDTAGGVTVGGVARFDGEEWSALGRGLDDAVRALKVFDDGGGPALYIGGDFTTAGGRAARRIARWDGSRWTQVGDGVNGPVWSLEAFDDGGGPALYAGGTFTEAGGVDANRIARWDGAQWSALGSGVSGLMPHTAVMSLAVLDDGNGPSLYAGGVFKSAGDTPASMIARWDGSQWSALGAGMSGTVRAMTVFDDGSGPALYVGGWFTLAGGLSDARYVARWNGSQWSALGTGVGGRVESLGVHDDGGGAALYVGGNFDLASGVPANRIARWDGSVWSAVGEGLPAVPWALLSFDDGRGEALFTGAFRWDGEQWAPIGPSGGASGMALAAFAPGGVGPPSLFVGGGFTTAGSVVSARIAEWTGCPPECPADWNGDGVVDSADLVDFLADWAAGDADFNGDGVTDSDDLLEFLAAWAEGC